jgi:hypothetical protein
LRRRDLGNRWRILVTGGSGCRRSVHQDLDAQVPQVRREPTKIGVDYFRGRRCHQVHWGRLDRGGLRFSRWTRFGGRRPGLVHLVNLVPVAGDELQELDDLREALRLDHRRHRDC